VFGLYLVKFTSRDKINNFSGHINFAKGCDYI